MGVKRRGAPRVPPGLPAGHPLPGPSPAAFTATNAGETEVLARLACSAGTLLRAE